MRRRKSVIRLTSESLREVARRWVDRPHRDTITCHPQRYCKIAVIRHDDRGVYRAREYVSQKMAGDIYVGALLFEGGHRHQQFVRPAGWRRNLARIEPSWQQREAGGGNALWSALTPVNQNATLHPGNVVSMLYEHRLILGSKTCDVCVLVLQGGRITLTVAIRGAIYGLIAEEGVFGV